jgi:Zn-dependent peptidase ImmA (M78 family)
MNASQVYQVPTSFFELLDPVYGPPVSVHAMLRGKADVTSRELDMITAELNIRLMHLTRFLEGVDFQAKTNIPTLDVEQYGSPDKIAATVRAHWGVPTGPVKNLTQLLERAGVVIAWSKLGGTEVSGVTFRVPGKPPIILLNEFHPADRMRFTLAHELGHLVMHRFPTANMEDEANRFGSAFLMPEAEIRAAFYGREVSLRELAGMKPEWKVAMQAILVRASSLSLVSSNRARYLWSQISTKGWRLQEPAELDFPREVPTILSRIVSSYTSDLGYSIEQLARMLRIFENQFVEMYGVSASPTPEKPRLRIVG